MRYQKKTNQRRAVILMVVLALLTLFALVGVTFVLYADAEATAARIFREAETAQAADVAPQQALAFFLSQLIYDVPDTAAGAASGLRGHSLARTMYGYQYPGLNVVPFNGIGRLHYASPLPYPSAPLTNVPSNWGNQLDDYALVNYTWFSGDNFVRDPERYGSRPNPNAPQNNPYVGGNAPYTYPDLNNFFLAAMKADGTVLVPSYHRPWLFQVVNGKYYPFNDMTNPNWTNPQGKYLTLRPRPAEHPSFPLPGDATGDVKNLPWAPGGNDSIWVDLGAPVMTAPDGTQYKMLFAPLIIDLDNRINLNTAGNILAYGTNNSTLPSVPHVSNQGWGGWEVNLGKVLYGNYFPAPLCTATQNSSAITGPSTLTMNVGDYVTVYSGTNVLTTTIASITGSTSFNLTVPWPYASGPVTVIDQEWVNLFTGRAQLSGQIVRGKYKASASYTPSTPGATIPLFPNAISLNTTYQHVYAQSDINGLNETSVATPPVTSSGRPLLPGFPANLLTSDPNPNPAVNPFASFQQGYNNGNTTEATNHPLLYNVFQTPLTSSLGTRAFTAQDQAALLQPNASINGPIDANASAVTSDLLRLCPTNFLSNATLASLPAAIKSAALRFRNLVTTQSWDIGSPGVTPYWWNGMTTGYLATNSANSFLLPPVAAQPAQGTAQGFPPLPPTAGVTNLPGTIPITSEFGPDWRAVSAISGEYLPTTNPAGYVSPGARIRLNRPLPPYPHMGAGLVPPYTSLPPGKTLSPYGMAYDLTNPAILNQYNAAQNARQALANDIYRRLLALAGLPKPANTASPTNAELAPRRWLAQLAVNIVDYIDEDDIMTPFNFYTTQDNNGAALAPSNPPTGTNPPTTQGPDDPTPTGANPDYWVFGTELPKVVLNEVLAEAQQLDTTQAAQSGESVKLWIELYNTMPAAGGTNTQPEDQWRVPLYINLPIGGGGYSPYRISISQYTMEQANSPANAPGTTAQLPDDSANVLGKAYISGPFPQSTTDADFSGVVQLSQNLANPPPNPPVVQAPFTVPGSGNTINAGVDAGNFFLIGPKTLPNDSKGNPLYENPFVYSTTSPSLPPNIPVLQTDSVTYKPTWVANPTNPDERTTGLTVMLRRLANPYLPAQLDPTKPNYNPYVTVDYIPSVPIQQSNQSILSFGKRQPYTGLLKLSGPITYNNGVATIPFLAPTDSPVAEQSTTATPPPPMGTIFTINNVSNTFGRTNYPLPPSTHYDWLVHLDRPPISPMELLHVSAWPPYKLTQKFMLGDDTVPANLFGHYARWLDSPPIAGIITLGGTATAGSPTITMSNTTGLTVGAPVNVISTTGPTTEEVFPSTISAIVPNTSITLAAPWPYNTGTVTVTTYNYTMACPWWFDPTLPAGSSHRLYRLFEFFECGDRAFGVNGLGRIPGKVNINTIWDAETLQALIDANLSMGIAPNPANTPLNLPGDVVSQIFTNMMISRSPAYYNMGTYTNTGTSPYPVPIGPVNMGTGLDDRPFMPLSMGQYLGKASGELQFPNGLSVTTDTILRTNNPFLNKNTAGNMMAYPPPQTATTPANQWLLFQNYIDGAAGGGTPGSLTTSTVHPYLQAQLLSKLFNNVTTRSNVFAVFLTVGFFQVIPGGAVGHPNIPQLGPEIGASEGKQIRHRMFAIVDRTNLTTFTTASTTPVTGITSTNFTGTQTIQLPVLPPPLTITGTGTGATAQLLVPNLNTGVPGVIQAGTQLVIDPGNINEETITVSAVTPPSGATPATITANFTLPHAAGATIIQRGNPGPWLQTPYDPRLDSNVVLYFSIIE